MKELQINKETEIQEKVEDLWKKLEDFAKYFKNRPYRYHRYLKLLFKGGQFVIKALVEETLKKHKVTLNGTLCEKEDFVRKVIEDHDQLDILYPSDQLSSSRESDISTWDISLLSTVYLQVLVDESVDIEVKEAINTIVTQRNSYAEAALISLDSDAFDEFSYPLKYSIQFLSRYLSTQNKAKFDTIFTECNSGRKTSGFYYTYLDELKNQGMNIKSIQDFYEETKANMEHLWQKMIYHRIPFKKEHKLKLKIQTPIKKLNKTVENILFNAIQDASKREDDRRDTLTQDVDKLLAAIENPDGVKSVEFKMGNKTVEILLDRDWETCVRTSNEKMAEELLKYGVPPNMETLNELCATFGRKSDIAIKVCKQVCCFIKELSQNITDVYASRKAVVLQRNGGKEDKFEIKFVVVTEHLNEKSRNELEKCIQTHYDTLPIRDRYQLSREETELAKKRRHVLKGKELQKMKTCLRLYAESLLKRHTYLTIIYGSPIKSVGYGTINHKIKETPCIVLNVPYKGFIPIDEDPFQKSYDGVLTDVREDIFVLFKGTAKERHDPLKAGCQISSERGKSGTLGGFVDLPDYGPCGISCGHVLLSPTEQKELSKNGEINWERPSILAGKNDSTFEKNVFQPEESQTVNNQIGGLVKVLHKRGNSYSLEIDAYGMDVALFQLNQRLPVSSEFPVVQVAEKADENYSNSPVFREIPQQFGKGAVAGFAWLEGKEYFKFGATTGYTTGKMSNNCGTSAKDPMNWIEKDDQNTFEYVLYNQVSIIKSNSDADNKLQIDNQDPSAWFGYYGDSGALVYQETTDGNLVCVGMVVGGALDKKECLVTPILPVLKALGITGFKDFDSKQMQDNVKILLKDTADLKQRVARIEKGISRILEKLE